jgi:flavin reductase (DIM6/NTAB) family NADH-FMN oxidoreductase RutF
VSRQRLTASSSDFIAAMGQHVSSVCVITTLDNNTRYGLTATAMSSVCAEPPRLLVCINKQGTSHEKILATGQFCVNVLSEHQDHIAKAFSGMLGRDFDKFSIGDWSTLVTGAPVLNGSTAVFDCQVKEIMDQFSHSIVIGEVLATSSLAIDPLLYGARKFRNLRKNMSERTGESDELLHF